MANRHHYLPQMYLRRWTTPVTPPMEPFLYAYFRGQAGPKRKAPRNIGYQPGLYEVAPEETTDGDPEALEKLFSRVEGLASGAFAYVDRHGHLLDPQQRLAMCDFVAGMFLRTRKEQLAQVKVALTRVDEVVANQLERVGGLDKYRLVFARLGGGPEYQSDEGLMSYLRALATRAAIEQSYRLTHLPSSCEKASTVFLGLNLSVITAPQFQQFVSSDSPVLLPTVNEPVHWWRTHEVGIGQEGVEVWFPLDPDRALLLTGKAVLPTMSLHPNQVEQVNQLCMRRSLEFVITHRRRPRIAAFMASLPPNDLEELGG